MAIIQKSLTTFILLLMITTALIAAETKPKDESLIVYGGNILTMDPSNPTTKAMLISNGIIQAVGTMDNLLIISPSSKMYNLQGKTIIPGFIDSHVHVHQLGAEQIKANLVGADSVKEMVTRLRSFYPNPTIGQWLIGQGWDEGKWASKGYPDRALLDEAFPNNPIYLQSLHGFASFYNNRALEIARINELTADPKVGQILKRANGQPTGVFLTLARDLVNKHIPEASVEERKRAIIAGLNLMASAGVTTVHEAGIGKKNLQAFLELKEADQLPIRVYGFLDGNDETLMKKMFKEGPILDPEHQLTIRGIKIYYDGSLGSRTALLRKPYSDEPSKANMTERITPERVASLADRAIKHKFQLAVHAIGDEANDRVLNIFTKAINGDKNIDHRWRIEHAQVVLPNYYQRVVEMGVISSMQSSHAVGDSGWAEDRLGKKRIQRAYAWQNILETGGRLIINSDLPGEPWRPEQTLHFAVTRQNLNDQPPAGWYPKQRLSIMTALKAMTSEPAYAAFQEDVLGSLKVGMLADFVILDKDLRNIPESKIKQLNVLSTWLNGKKIWSSSMH